MSLLVYKKMSLVGEEGYVKKSETENKYLEITSISVFTPPYFSSVLFHATAWITFIINGFNMGRLPFNVHSYYSVINHEFST